MNKYSYLFIATLLERMQEKYSFNREINDIRINKERILLPIDDNGQPDYAFMEQYIREREQQLIQKYIAYIGQNIQTGGGCLPLDKKDWKGFRIDKLFDIFTGGDMIIARLKDGHIPLISHSLTENGVAKYIKYQHNSLADRGNFGGLVQIQDFYIGTRVKALKIKEEFEAFVDENCLMFICTSINAQAEKFNYGNNCTNKTGSLMIMLPVANEDQPDWKYMSSFAKTHLGHLKLEYLKRKVEESKGRFSNQ